MKRKTAATFREGQIVARARALQAEMQPNTWPYCMFFALWEVGSSSSTLGPDYWGAMRRALTTALREHAERFKYVFDDAPFPADMASYLATALEDLAEGEDHPLFAKRILTGGRGNLRPRVQQESIDRAVDYLIAVDLGLIDDNRSRATVADQFGVTRKQVQRWLAVRGTKRRREGEFRQRWERELSRAHDPARTLVRMVRKRMQFSAADYREHRSRRSSRK